MIGGGSGWYSVALSALQSHSVLRWCEAESDDWDKHPFCHVSGSSCHLASPPRSGLQTWSSDLACSFLHLLTAARPPLLLLQEAGKDRCCSRLAAWTNLDPNTGYNVGPTHFIIPVFCPDSWLHSISISELWMLILQPRNGELGKPKWWEIIWDCWQADRFVGSSFTTR